MTTVHRPYVRAESADEVDLKRLTQFVRGDAHHAWRMLRDDKPVHWTEGNEYIPGFWSITKYEDIITVSRDTTTFISSRGINIATNYEQATDASGLGKMLITMDPPRHVRLRRLVNKGFTPKMVAQMEPHVREITTAILDSVAPQGQCDFVTQVAARLPLAVICEMMGIDRKDWDLMFDLTNRVLGAEDPEYQDTDEPSAESARATAAEGQRRMFMTFARIVAERRQHRRDDLLSILIDAEIDDEKLSDEEILYFAYLLILAGNETTRNAISGGMLAFVENPAERARLAADPSLIDSAVEEVLRYTSPVMHMTRYATVDTAIRGQAIRAGERVAMWYPSANRDADIFPEPDRFDIGRTPNEHLAFGLGEHFCLGAGLARLELRVIYQEIFRRLPDIELAGDVERLRSNFIGGIKHMPVRFTPERP
ncbi:MAG TPA: cytochrome P450 [Tepidiformaceae bacterium]|nr:cytochrome P450 [Tepidiformaceae bacterium]